MKPVATPTSLYRVYGGAEDLLYIGIARDFGRRWKQHAASQPWWPEVRRLTVDWYPSLERAILAEASAIRDERPRHNVTHNAGTAYMQPAAQLAPSWPLRPTGGPGAPREPDMAQASDRPKPVQVELYDAETAGRILHQTGNWMKAKARAGLIPHSRVDDQYMWTNRQLWAIVRAAKRPARNRDVA